jgi:hypothetical protein
LAHVAATGGASFLFCHNVLPDPFLDAHIQFSFRAVLVAHGHLRAIQGHDGIFTNTIAIDPIEFKHRSL